MKNTMVSIKNFIKFSKLLYARARYFENPYLRSKNLEILVGDQQKMRRLRDKHKGKRCFIIGNGPSLNNMDLTLLKNEITIGVNAIYLNFDKMGFKPTYYVVEDISVAEDRGQDINKLTGMTKIIPLYLAFCLKRTNGMIYVNHDVTMTNFPEFSRDASVVTYQGSTVTYLNMQLAYHLGCDPVYLIGVDFDYKIPDSAVIKGAEITSMEDDPNHFHPNYFGKGYKWHLPRLDVVLKAYQHAEKVYKENGRKIINATVGGKLEVFERVHYNNLF